MSSFWYGFCCCFAIFNVPALIFLGWWAHTCPLLDDEDETEGGA